MRSMILHGDLLIDPQKPPMRGWLAVEDARISEVGEGDPPERPAIEKAGEILPLIVPGFIDAHLHLPQVDAIGFDGMELLDWLDRVIFPAEMRWADPAAAAAQIASAYQRLWRCGTLGFAAFLTSHFHGYVETVRVGHRLPLRAVVGQSLMDRNATTELLNQPLTRIASSERARVACSINPRFAVSCSDQLLQIARRKKEANPTALVHTHLAENRREVELVRRLFPDDANYAAVYDRHGLLTKQTLLAHAVHLSDDEWELIAQRGCVVVHCPTANTFLKSGLFDLGAAQEHGVRLALGSDIAAGPDFAMPRVARAMIEVAKMRAMTVEPNAPIPTPAQAWTLITRGNADALGFHDAGRLEIGAAADLLVLHTPFEHDADLVGRLIYTWRDDYITHRVLNGRLVASGG